MHDDLKARTVRGLGWNTIQSWSLRLVGFLVYPILARLLGPETYGLIALAGVFIAILDIFSDVSFGAAIEQRQELAPEHVNAIFWTFLGLGLVLGGGSIAAAPLVAAFFKEPALPPVIRWLSLVFFLKMISGVQTSLLRRELKMKALTSQTLCSVTAGSAVGLTMAFNGWGVWSLVGQRLVTQLISTIMLWRLSPWRPQKQFSSRHFREIAGFGFSVMGNRVLGYLNQRLDQFLVGRFLGTVELGLYFNAHRLMSLATGLLIGSYSQITMPAFAKLQDDLPRIQSAFNQTCRFITLVAFPAFTSMAILAEELIVVLLGEQWRASAPVLQILSLSGMILAVQYVNGAAMMAMGRADLRLILLAIYGICNTIAFMIAVRHGIVAVAAAYTICVFLLAPLDILLNRKLGIVSVRTLLRSIRAQGLAMVVMAAAVLLLKYQLLDGLTELSRLAIGLFSGVLIYGITVVMFERRLWSECIELLRLLRSKPESSAGPDVF